MRTVSRENEKEIAQEILKLLDGLPYSVAKKIIDNVSQDIFEVTYVELKPFQTFEVGLSTKKLDELNALLAEFNRNHPADDDEDFSDAICDQHF